MADVVDDRDGTKARALTEQLAPLLPGWAIDPLVPTDYGCAEVVRRADGARVRIRVGPWRHAGRVVLTGAWPHFADGRYHHHGKAPTVTIDACQPPAAIAKALLGRLLRAYGPEYAAALVYVRRADERAAEARLVASGIAHAAGGAIRGREHYHGSDVRIGEAPGVVSCLRVQPGYGSGEYAREVRVSFHVDGLDPETAAEVMALIRRSEEARLAPAVAMRVDPGALAAPEREADVPEAAEPALLLRLGAEDHTQQVRPPR